MNDDRTIDEQIVMRIFGWSCGHRSEPVPEAMWLADARARFYERYGQHAPPTWKPEEPKHQPYCSCASLSTKPLAGYWCPKCGLRDDCLPYMEYYSRYWESARKVIEEMQSRGMQVTIRSRTGLTECEFIKGILSHGVATAPTAPEAICLAALKAVA